MTTVSTASHTAAAAADRWYRQAVVYSLSVDAFADGDGDGHGDFRGLRSRLTHLARLGVTCLWLNPVHPTPDRDHGYDVTDYYAVDPRLGTLGDFVEFVHEAAANGIRVVLDLVVNHTSDEHPWFVSARSDPASPYRDFYVWSATEPPDRHQGIVFPGEQEETWSWDEEAGLWYYHRFYGFQPDLNWRNPAVREEIRKIMGFWLQLGVAGFRVDAAPFVLEQTAPGDDAGPLDFGILDEWRQHLQWRRGDAVLLAEANVSPDDVGQYFGSSPDVADRLHMLFDFVVNPRLWLALAREDAEPLVDSLGRSPRLPAGSQWATFLRNHDELDLSRLSADQRSDVMKAFAPSRRMRVYDRGIRRRSAPMFDGDRRRTELAYSLQFSMVGTPVLRYGEEIGMGDDLSLDGRDAVRTPMQWDGGRNGGFSTAAKADLVRPVVTRGPFAARHVNVMAQRGDRGSLLTWFQRLIGVRRECPEIGCGTASVVEPPDPDRPFPRGVLVHRVDGPSGSLLFLHNLTGAALDVDLRGLPGTDSVEELFSCGRGTPIEPCAPHGVSCVHGAPVELPAYGYRWIRTARSA